MTFVRQLGSVVGVAVTICAVAPAGVAWVDTEPLVAGSSSPATCGSSQQLATTTACSLDQINWLLADSLRSLPGVAVPTDVLPAAGQQVSGSEIRQVPPPPSSAALALCALATLGAYQGGRSLRRVHFVGGVPEWYHYGGPAQVGHATPLDLEFNLSAMPICRFEAPAAGGSEQPSPQWLRPDPRVRLHSQYSLLIADPRGPPMLP